MTFPLTSALNLYSSSGEADFVFSYRGPFYDNLTERIVNISEHTVADHKGLVKVNRRVSFLLVECFQNIIKHGEKKSVKKIEDDGFFTIRSISNAYVINSINKVKSEEIKSLVDQVDEINSKSKVELKELYMKHLQENQLSEKGGAGLGLIELARKSGQKIKYRVEEVDGDSSNFHQQITFFYGDDQDALDYIDQTSYQYSQLEDSEIMLTYKGSFTQKSILPLLQIVESNLSRGSNILSETKRAGHIMIEMLQNISRHAKDNVGFSDGILVLKKDGDGLSVISGNSLGTNEGSILEKKLDELSNLNQEEINLLHRERMKQSIYLEDKNSSGLGLMQILKASRGKFKYDFSSINQKSTFFSMIVSV